jgi:hypothetical protein
MCVKHPKLDQLGFDLVLTAYQKHDDQGAIQCEIGRLIGVLVKVFIASNAHGTVFEDVESV